eukprot:8241268-Prorocentrum_lima.AAC.1
MPFVSGSDCSKILITALPRLSSDSGNIGEQQTRCTVPGEWRTWGRAHSYRYTCSSLIGSRPSIAFPTAVCVTPCILSLIHI